MLYFWAPKDLADAIRESARQKDISISEVLREAAARYLEIEPPKKKHGKGWNHE